MKEKQLFEDVERILELSKTFRQKIEWAKTPWLHETEALKLFESQVQICETIRDLVKAEKYTEAFILNRTLFENFFLICLILKGSKYIRRYKIPVKPNENPKEIYNRLTKGLEGRKDIVSFKPLKNYGEIEVVHKGLYPKEGDRLIPVYYFVFKEYDPVKHRVGKIKSIMLKDFSPEVISKWQKEHESLYKAYFGFENLVKAAVLNDIITEKQTEKVRVHYNFLSAFTHLTNMSFEIAHSYKTSANKHYLMELNLLYVLSILRYYLLLLIDFFTKTEHSIKDIDQIRQFLKEQEQRYNYFWFIFNEPSEYDYFNYQTIKKYRQLTKRELLDEEIPYYKNPYERLKRQHQNIIEFSTGVYKSPWPE
ncbi:MAG: DUF5677 domain-containing protein [Candidatus Bathyarchaeia archaeon]